MKTRTVCPFAWRSLLFLFCIELFGPPCRGDDVAVISGWIKIVGGKIDALVDDLEVFTLAVTPDDLLWAAGDFESHYNRGLPSYARQGQQS